MPLLAARLELHGIRDVEAFAGQILDEFLRKTQGHLRPHDREDAVSYVVATVWELSNRWDRERGISFSTYSHRIAKLRIVDWYRKRFSDQRFGGDTRRNIDFAVSLDAAADGSADGDPLGHTIAGGTGDFAAGGSAGLLGALEGGRRATLEDTVIVRDLASPSARRRDRRRRAQQQAAGTDVEVETTSAT